MNRKNLFKKGAIALSLAAGLSTAGTAGATALGQSILTLNNFRFLNTATGAELAASDFTTLRIHDSTNLSPSLNGVNAPVIASTDGGVPLLSHQSVVGTYGAGAYTNAVTPPATNAALGASNLTGSPIAGLVPGNALATAQTASLSQITGNGYANSSANLILDTQFTFTLANDLTQGITVDFDTIVHLLAYLDSANGSAHGGTSWNINLSVLNGPTVFNWSPDGTAGGITGGTEIADSCNMNASRTVLQAGQTGYDCTGREAATSVALTAGTQYQLSISHNTLSDVTVVPEPDTIAVMGLGLLGLGLVSRRKSKKA